MIRMTNAAKWGVANCITTLTLLSTTQCSVGAGRRVTNLTYMPDKLPFNDAVTACHNMGGHLVEITDETKSNMVLHFMQEFTTTLVNITFGLVAQTPDLQNYYWAESCRPLSWSNWAPGVPNNSRPGRQCARLMLSPGYWLTRWCGKNHNYMCEQTSDEECPYERLVDNRLSFDGVVVKNTSYMAGIKACFHLCNTIISESHWECWAFNFFNSTLQCVLFFTTHPYLTTNTSYLISDDTSDVYAKRCFYGYIGEPYTLTTPPNKSPIPSVNCSFVNYTTADVTLTMTQTQDESSTIADRTSAVGSKHPESSATADMTSSVGSKHLEWSTTADMISSVGSKHPEPSTTADMTSSVDSKYPESSTTADMISSVGSKYPESSTTADMTSTVGSNHPESSTTADMTSSVDSKHPESSTTADMISSVGSKHPELSTTADMISSVGSKHPEPSTTADMTSSVDSKYPESSTTSDMISSVGSKHPESSTTADMTSTVGSNHPESSTTADMTSSVDSKHPESSTTADMISSVGSKHPESRTTSDMTPSVGSKHPESSTTAVGSEHPELRSTGDMASTRTPVHPESSNTLNDDQLQAETVSVIPTTTTFTQSLSTNVRSNDLTLTTNKVPLSFPTFQSSSSSYGHEGIRTTRRSRVTSLLIQATGKSSSSGEPEERRRYCRCFCGVSKSVSEKHKGSFLEALLADLTINKADLSSYRRKYNSARDNRPLSVGMGYTGIGMVALVVIIIILSDVTAFVLRMQ